MKSVTGVVLSLTLAVVSVGALTVVFLHYVYLPSVVQDAVQSYRSSAVYETYVDTLRVGKRSVLNRFGMQIEGYHHAPCWFMCDELENMPNIELVPLRVANLNRAVQYEQEHAPEQRAWLAQLSDRLNMLSLACSSVLYDGHTTVKRCAAALTLTRVP